MDKNLLVKRSIEAQHNARVPYSGFRVGAALLSKSGEIITGCNIESSSFSLTICAERVALAKALSEGYNDFEAIAITAEKQDYVPPCGACRQLLYDYAPNLTVVLSNGTKHDTYHIKDLLPKAFDDSKLTQK